MPSARAPQTESILDAKALLLPELGLKKLPTQKRALETYELILAVAARVLVDVGVDRLSTNLVCKEAGLSPAALYRYFPNKYALLHELGVRLMNAQNVLVESCLTPEVLMDPVDRLQPALVQLFLETYRVTCETPAGHWITRALRAVPSLQEVRLQSHQAVTAEMQHGLSMLHPTIDPEQMRVTVRMSVDMTYAALEMLFDDPTLDLNRVAQTNAWLVYDMFNRLGTVKR
jgi:AcrR family transcriptional regulator